MAASENGPGGDSVKSKGFGLLVERMNSSRAESLLEFPELGQLSRLHLCLGLLTMLFRLVLTAARSHAELRWLMRVHKIRALRCDMRQEWGNFFCYYLPKICPGVPA